MASQGDTLLSLRNMHNVFIEFYFFCDKVQPGNKEWGTKA